MDKSYYVDTRFFPYKITTYQPMFTQQIVSSKIKAEFIQRSCLIAYYTETLKTIDGSEKRVVYKRLRKLKNTQKTIKQKFPEALI